MATAQNQVEKAIQKMIDEESRCEQHWVVVVYDPAYASVRNRVYQTQEEAEEKIDELRAEGRRPRLFMKNIDVEFNEIYNF